MNLKKISKNKGFTLIEILVVIGIIAVLATIVLIAINPARQFAQARDTQRVSNLNVILNAVGQKTSDCKGKFNASNTECPSIGGVACPPLPGPLLSDAETIVTSGTGLNLSCLIPTYISSMPSDPIIGTSISTGYRIYQDAVTSGGRIHVLTTDSTAEEPNIPRTAEIEIIR